MIEKLNHKIVIHTLHMSSTTMPKSTIDNTIKNTDNSNNRPQPKYKRNDIIITKQNQKRHICFDPCWSSDVKTYVYSVDYGLGLTSDGEVIETNIERIANTSGPDARLPL